LDFSGHSIGFGLLMRFLLILLRSSLSCSPKDCLKIEQIDDQRQGQEVVLVGFELSSAIT
jgi:hypothetical protein